MNWKTLTRREALKSLLSNSRRPRRLLAESLEERRLLAAVIRSGVGGTPAEIQGIVDQFRTDLGDPLNGATPGSAADGRREINWDGVSDELSAPNALPGDFFNTTSPRGVIFETLGTGFSVSAKAGNGAATPVRFGDINAAYTDQFQAFSAERLFTPVGSNQTTVQFRVPGSNLPATVSGFGAVFTDVDIAGGTTIEFFDENGNSLNAPFVVDTQNNGLSFLGVSFDAGERVSRVVITSGTLALAAGAIDGGTDDVVAMDDFLYAEPQPLNPPLAAADDAYAASEDDVLTVAAPGLMANDTSATSVTDVDEASTWGATITFSADGGFSYDPRTAGILQALKAGQTLEDEFKYEVTDGFGNTTTADVIVTVTGANDAPVAVNDDLSNTPVFTIDEEEIASAGQSAFLINDTDPDGDTLNIISVSPTSAFGAAVTLNEEGVVSYNPRDAALLDSLSEGQEILDTFVYTVSDGNGGTDTGIITLRVVGLNDEPVAADDAFNATTTAALSIPRTDLLANDTDVDQQDVLIVSGFVAVSAKGALITAADANTISYDPTGVAEFAALGVGESTTDTFTYTISDGHGGVSTATVTITVTRSNSVPVGVDDAYATNADVTLSVPAAGVLTNDTDPDAGDTLSVVAGGVTSTLGAAVTLNADGSFSYDGTGAGQLIALAAGQVVEDSFTYTLTDAAGAEATATVRITVTGVNNAPNAGADTGEVQEDETLTVLAGALFTNDADPDTGDTFAAVSENITSTLGAKVAITADGGYVYDPTESAQLQALKPGETIQDTFTYTIQDAAGLTATGLVTITVNGANDAPTAVNDIGEVNEDAELNVPANGLLANDTDPDATDVLKVVAGTITSQYGATVTLNEDGSYVYDPRNALTIRTLKQGETAVDTFQYTMRDEAGAESTATVSITVTGTAADTIAPTISVSSVTVAETDGATMIFTITLEHASFQTITVDYTTADGTATAGADYTALSGALTFNPQQLTQQIVVTVLNDTDVESPETLLLNLSNAVNTFNATASGTGTITDDDNQPPVAGADTGETDEDSILTVADPLLTANDTDPDNHVPLVVVAEAVTSAQGAAVTINADGSYSYDPTAAAALQALGVGESIVDTFTYKVRDSLGAESVGTVSITVNGLNDAPTVVGDVFDANEDQVLTISAPGLLANDSDVDGDALQLTTLGTSNLGAIVVINQDGSFTYDPTNVAQIQQLAAGASIQDFFFYTVSDGNGGSVEGLVTITVTGENDAPTAVADTGAVNEDVVLTVDAAAGVLVNDTDVEPGSVLSVEAATITSALGAAVTINADGSYSYDPRNSATIRTLAIGQTASDTFTYTLVDDAGAQSTGTVTITLTGTTDDALPQLTINDVALEEGDSGETQFVFTVSIDFASVYDVTVNYATAEPQGIDGATADSDFTTATGLVTIPAGSTSASITISVLGDEMFENNEVFLVQLSQGVNASIADNEAVGTITNDDEIPAMSIADASIEEGDEGTTNLTFTVTLSNASENPVTVDFATADGTAIAGDDYVAQTGSLTFAAGETSKTITIVVNGDETVEVDESFTVTLANVVGATITEAVATGTIVDDDDVPAADLSINDVSVTEGNNGTVEMTFTVTLSAAQSGAVTVEYATANGTAIAPGDYAAQTGTLTFAAGETTKTITVLVAADTLDELDETLTVTLSNPTNGVVLSKATGTGTINDDDEAPTISIGDVTIVEGDSGTTNAVFTVTLSAASGQAVTVNYATADGTAVAGTDYVAGTGQVSFAPGETSKTISVQITGDTTIEQDEEFVVNLTSPVNATIADAQGEATIEDDDAPGFSINDVSVTEGNTGTVQMTFTVTLSEAQSGPVTVNYSTSNGTAIAGTDYTAASGTLTFAAGELTKTFTVTVAADTIDEDDETFTVTLSNPSNGIALLDATGTGTINDDDAPPTMSISDATAIEGDSGTVDMVFTVTLSGASGRTVTVPFNVVSGTAIVGSDIEAQSGTLTFAPGETSKTITVKVIGDTIDEATENFTVSLGGPTNASLVDGVGTGTIEDNDPTPQGPTLSIGDVQIVEGNDGTKQMVFTVTLSVSSTSAVTVNYATSDGSATAGNDYTTTNGTLTFAAGETTKTISVPIAGDTTAEPHETLFVTLTNPSGATISDGSAIGTITNDDGTVNVSISDATVNEGNSGTTTATFTVTLSAASAQTVTVNFATAAGTATAGTDFVANNGTITFAPGETSKTITVTINGDTLDEANETYSVTLTSPTNATLLDDTGAGVITDDDPTPTVSIADQSIAEGNTGTKTMTFTVTLSAASGLPVTVNYATAGGTATSGTDFVAGSGTVTIAAGQTSATFTVTINGDTTVEQNETFTVTLASPSNATIADGTATGTITDDDSAVTISIADASVTEGNSGTATMTFTITLSGPSGQSVTVAYATSNGTATQPGDYTQASGTVTFAPGETSKTITVTVVGDSLDEANETFTVTLTNPTNATLADATATGTITDDDTAGTIQFANAVFTVNEGAGTVTITVTRTGGTAANATVNYTTSNGSATSGSDYTTASGTITFLAGETSKTFTISIANDSLLESLETINLTLSSPGGGATLGAQSTATVNITDNDGNTNQRFVNSLYEDLLGRQGEQQGIDFYVDLLVRGQSRGDVSFMIQHSPEYRNKLVGDLYQEILGRAADPAGLDVHAQLLARGKSIDDVRAALLSSDEFFTRRGGGTNDGYVNALYQTVLGRAVDATGRGIYGNVLSGGGSRGFVASEVLKSIEADRRQSSQYYTKYLGRTADTAGNEFQANAMNSGYEPRVLAGILASDEYFSKL